MKTGIFDASQIQGMMAQLKAAAARPTERAGSVNPLQSEKGAGKVDFAEVLKSSLEQVNSAQQKAEVMGQRFALGDDSVNLSDVMISMQKANINFQATVQVRNKLVSAYQEIMGMQV
jgi:flagellar hook-basal body complex protein FliE